MLSNIVNNGDNNSILIKEGASIQKGFSFVIDGDNNDVTIDRGANLRQGRVHMRSSGNKLVFGKNILFNGGIIFVAGKGELIFGDATTVMGARISFHEDGRIIFGEDCMLSSEIRMDVSDMHSIIDQETGLRINPPGDIVFGNHVWVGFGVFVTNGVTIGDNSIIGAKALVSGDIPAGCLAVGVPARVLRDNVTWDRRRLPTQ